MNVRSNTLPFLHVAQLGAHERATLARLDVLELDDLEQAVVELERDPVLQVVGGDGRHGESLGDAVSARQPSLGDDHEVFDADTAEALTIDARFHGHHVPDLQFQVAGAVDERILVDQQADAVAGAVGEPLAVTGRRRSRRGTRRRARPC